MKWLYYFQIGSRLLLFMFQHLKIYNVWQAQYRSGYMMNSTLFWLRMQSRFTSTTKLTCENLMKPHAGQVLTILYKLHNANIN